MRYDILIVGGGIAGATAAIYAKMAGLDVAIIEKDEIGGKLNYISEIYNYPGLYKIKGEMFAEQLKIQLKELKIQTIYEEAKRAEKINENFLVCTSKNRYESEYLIIATGSEPKELKNIRASYCEICDGHLYKNKDISIIGGGDAAFNCALYMSNIANTIYILMRGAKPRANRFLIDKALSKPNITIFSNVEVKEQKGNQLTLNDGSTIESDAVFVKIGNTINLEPFKNVIGDPKAFLAGDCRGEKLNQLIKCSHDSMKIIEKIKNM